MRRSGCQRDRLNVVFLFASGGPVACGTLARRTVGGLRHDRKEGLCRARSHRPACGMGAVAGAVLCDVGCAEELTSPLSFPVPAGISKSGASPLAASPEPCRQSRYRADPPTIRGRPQRRSGALADGLVGAGLRSESALGHLRGHVGITAGVPKLADDFLQCPMSAESSHFQTHAVQHGRKARAVVSQFESLAVRSA
jgi:hypothetical protein